MTLREIQDRIDSIVKMRGDDEAAHAAEDRLRADFIKYIATGADDAQRCDLAEMADLIASTEKIGFERWCA